MARTPRVSLFLADIAKPLGVTAPQISIAAAVTPSELRVLLGKQDLTKGFANRRLIASQKAGSLFSVQ